MNDLAFPFIYVDKKYNITLSKLMKLATDPSKIFTAMGLLIFAPIPYFVENSNCYNYMSFPFHTLK